MKDIDAVVRAFAEVLRSSWRELDALSKQTTTQSYLEDWMQANWEMIVEGRGPPGEFFLEVYGEGADCNGQSSRVYLPEALPTHAVVCVPAAADGLAHDMLSDGAFTMGAKGMALEEFVTMEGEWFSRKPPFDCVLLDDDGQDRVVSAQSIRFALGPARRE